MEDGASLSCTNWERKHYVAFILKCRQKTLYLQLWQHLGWRSRRRVKSREGICVRISRI